MMNSLRLLALLAVLPFSPWAMSVAGASYADPPERVAHLDDIQGGVSYSRSPRGASGRQFRYSARLEYQC
jgi:hypothetical protein